VVWLYGLCEATAAKEAAERLALRAGAGGARAGKAGAALRAEMPTVASVVEGTRPAVPEEAVVWLGHALLRLRAPRAQGGGGRADVAADLARRIRGCRVRWDGRGRLNALLRAVHPVRSLQGGARATAADAATTAVGPWVGPRQLAPPPPPPPPPPDGAPDPAVAHDVAGQEEKQLARFLRAVERTHGQGLGGGGGGGGTAQEMRAVLRRRRRRKRARRWDGRAPA